MYSADELLGVKQLAVGARADFINDSRLEVDKHRAGHVLASARLREERLEGVVAATRGGVGGHLAVGLDAVLEEFPARVTGLATGLADVDGNAFAHTCKEWGVKKAKR